MRSYMAASAASEDEYGSRESDGFQKKGPIRFDEGLGIITSHFANVLYGSERFLWCSIRVCTDH